MRSVAGAFIVADGLIISFGGRGRVSFVFDFNSAECEVGAARKRQPAALARFLRSHSRPLLFIRLGGIQ